MTYSYFPGCTLKTKGKELDIWGRASADALGLRLEELPEWQCCGAVYPMAKDEIATRLSSVRALMAAQEKNQALVTLCSACHHVIKRVNGDMKNDENIRDRVARYLGLETPYAPSNLAMPAFTCSHFHIRSAPRYTIETSSVSSK